MSANIRIIDPGVKIWQTIVYAYSCPYDDHRGMLKVGQTGRYYPTREENICDDSESLKEAARSRILEETKTAAISFDIVYVTLFRYEILNEGAAVPNFDDMVRRVITNSGFKKAEFEQEAGREWVVCDVNVVKAAVRAVREERTALDAQELKDLKHIPEIRFYPHQQECLKWTEKRFKKNNNLLWQIKPRGGKTVTAIELIRRMGFKKTLIYTARPDVNQEWKNAFEIIFASKEGKEKWQYGSRAGIGVSNFDELMQEATDGNVIWFASTQFLRRKDETATAEIRRQILDTKWDLVIIDEAHEATLTTLGQDVENKAKKEHTKILKLSGTPFNLLDQYSKDEVFTFDYNEEMKRKTTWDAKKEGYANPYARMPQIHLRTVELSAIIKGFKTAVNAFSFKEFFRTEPDATEFVHEKDVLQFLDLLRNENEESFYPYCSVLNCDTFKHTLWVLPGVEAGRALSKLLQQHSFFMNYEIINVCGDGDEEKPSKQATKEVRNGIKNYWKKNKFGTITLSCGKLTTGVTIPEWKGVLMLKGGNTSDAKQYLQTAFRVQGPYDSPDGIRKTSCYVFDFAPDRALSTLCIICQANKNGDKAASKLVAKDMLQFFPVLSYDGNRVVEHNVDTLFRWYNQAAAERVKARGCDDSRLYNINKIYEAANSDTVLDEIFENWGREKAGVKTKHTVNAQGASGNATKSAIRWTCPNCGKKDIVEPVCPNCSTPHPKSRWICKCGHTNYDARFCGGCGSPKPERAKDESKERADKLIKVLRNISIRIPLLAFGVDVESDEELRLENFASLIDDKSWAEFMPTGFPKETDGETLGFDYFRQFIDEDVFVNVCTEIRKELKEADELMPEERVKALIDIIRTFKNPAKETIITPWEVVNLHLGETIGGEVFYDIEGQDFHRVLPSPMLVDHAGRGVLADIHSDVLWDKDAKVLEINSKSGVYPLFLAYSMYKIHSSQESDKTFEKDVWTNILEKNIFVLCQTQMAVKITNRVLRGFHLDWKTNCVYKENLVEYFTERYNSKESESKQNEINSPDFWGLDDDEMIKFTLAVSNPPYQGNSHLQIYPLFYHNAIDVADTVSMIFPSNWQEASKKSAKGLSRMNNEETKRDRQIVFIDNRKDVFNGIAGASDTNIILWKRGYNNGLEGSQKVYTEGQNPESVRFAIEMTDRELPEELKMLHSCIQGVEGKNYVSFEVSKFDAFRIPSSIFKRDYANAFSDIPSADDDVVVWGNEEKRTGKYHKNDFEEKEVKKKGIIDHIDCVSSSSGFTFRKDAAYGAYKVFIPKLWGNLSTPAGIGGSYANVMIASPNEICSYSFNVCGVSDNKEKALFTAKYLMTKFLRAMLAINKKGKDATSENFKSVPAQDYHEPWWNESIAQIDEHLFEKYNVPAHIRDFVRNNIQTCTEENIINL